MTLRFSVRGMPQTKGSWRPVRGKHTGKTVMLSDNPAEKSWAAQVAWAARAALRNRCNADAQRYAVQLDFALPPRPNRTRTNQRDLDKLARSCLDALTGLVWVDDEQVDALIAVKRVADMPGAVVTIVPVDQLRGPFADLYDPHAGDRFRSVLAAHGVTLGEDVIAALVAAR